MDTTTLYHTLVQMLPYPYNVTKKHGNIVIFHNTRDERIADICSHYQMIADKPDEIAFSVDEMTGSQALERIAADRPMSPGKPAVR